jgi:hypothetical protein
MKYNFFLNNLKLFSKKNKLNSTLKKIISYSLYLYIISDKNNSLSKSNFSKITFFSNLKMFYFFQKVTFLYIYLNSDDTRVV